MPGRRRVYTGSSDFRYKIKMFDYLSKGGRIPSYLVLPAIEAMNSERTKKFGNYKGAKDGILNDVMNRVNLPNVLRGITIGLFYKCIKMYNASNVKDVNVKRTILEQVRNQHPVEDERVWQVLEEAFVNEYEAPSETAPEGAKTGGSKSTS